MARLDLGGLRDLWYRIDDIFARLTEAAGSISWSSPTLTLHSVAGGSLGSVNLNDGLATDAEAGHSLSFNSGNGNVTLKNVNGGGLSSVDLDTRYATRGQAAHTLSRDGNTLYLNDVDGGTNSTVTLPAVPDVSGFIHASTANARYGHSLYYNSSTKQLSLISYDGTALSTVTLS